VQIEKSRGSIASVGTARYHTGVEEEFGLGMGGERGSQNSGVYGKGGGKGEGTFQIRINHIKQQNRHNKDPKSQE